MNNSYLNEMEYVSKTNTIIESAYSRLAHCDPSTKMEITNFSKDYAKIRTNERKKEAIEIEQNIKSLHKKLNMINLSSDNAVNVIEKVNTKLDFWLQKQQKLNNYRVQGQMLRAKPRWVENAEKNSSYFFGLEKFKAKAKCMGSCYDERGNLMHSSNKILQEQCNFYTKLYKKDPNVDFKMENKSGKRLNTTQRLILESEIEENEITEAIRSMANGKSPGEDGFSAEWYKVFYCKIKPMLVELYKHVKTVGRLHQSARRGLLTLIPRKDRDRNYIKNWRLIALLSVEYKIFAKVLANRIKLTLNDLIDPAQRGFIKGRNITDNVRQVFDVMELMWLQNTPGLVISVDFEKAFD